MNKVYSLSEAKARFSEIINRVLFRSEKFTITKKGKAVALVLPLEEKPAAESQEGLIRARGVLKEIDLDIQDMVESIYEGRKMARDRKVQL